MLSNVNKEYKVILVASKGHVYNGYMKKDTVITLRVTPEIKAIIQRLADKDERTLAWMARKLIIESLESRGAVRKSRKKSE